jgi:hypothetical protein
MARPVEMDRRPVEAATGVAAAAAGYEAFT